MSRIVIIGSGGRLGAALAREWAAAGDEVIRFNHGALDLGDPAAIHLALDSLDFDVLVNCAAQTNVDRCETHREEAFRINATAPASIAAICHRKHRRFIHISTDYVFDGAKRTPYTETDVANPISIYGESKNAGDNHVLRDTEGQALVVRVSWVFGPDRPSFVDQILQRAREHENVEAIADKWAVPTYTLDAAKLLHPFLVELRFGGLLHLCNRGQCTWQEYGQFALDCAASAGIELKTRAVGALAMADLKAFVAKRPVYTAMSTAKLAEITGITPRPWQEAVEEHISQLRDA